MTHHLCLACLKPRQPIAKVGESFDSPTLRQPVAAQPPRVRHCAYVVHRCSPRGAQADAPRVYTLRFDCAPARRAESGCAQAQPAFRCGSQDVVFSRCQRLHDDLPILPETPKQTDSAAAQPVPVRSARSCAPVRGVRTAGHVWAARRGTPGLYLAARRRYRIVDVKFLNHAAPQAYGTY